MVSSMPSDSLEDYGIFVKREGTASSLVGCPQQLKDLFTLILNVQFLEWDYFGGTPQGDRSIQTTPIMQYESELKLEAEELATNCLDYKRPDDIEEKWVEVMQPIVFYRFNREAEELYTRKRHHHCFICGKHFPLRSRPLLNVRSPRLFEHKIRGVHGDNQDSEDADVCKLHPNVPNFDTGKLAYLEYQDEGMKIPDLTIGLLAWSENAWHAPLNMTKNDMDNILEHNLIKPFRYDILHNLEREGFIKPLFAFPKSKKGTHVKRSNRSSVTFPFTIWEAKKASEGDPVAQNALKVKMILEWQQDLAKRAKIAWEPLMFHFVSVGSEWKVYACHVQSISRKKTKNFYPFRLLWSGDCANQTKALQLLHLIDIIALWGQFQYKPFAGACIRILKKQSKEKAPWRFLETNLLEHQKIICPRNFQSIHSYGVSSIKSTNPIIMLRRAGTDTSEEEINKQLMQGMRLLSLENYFIPERDGFIWLTHRGLRGADLLVVRVNTGGSVLPPLVIFNSSNWKSLDFEHIIREERARMPQNVGTAFRYSKDHISVLQKCFSATNGYCTMPEIQFCAILPLNRRRTIDDTNAQKDFQPLEQLLGLQTLLDAAQRKNELWCVCQKPESGNMILCDATKCTIGWYHNECVGLHEAYDAKDWVCRACKKSSSVAFSSYDNEDFEKGILPASDMRIQRARSLNRAWNDHKWPHPRDVRDLMYGKICCEIEMETNPLKFRSTVDCLEAERYTSATRNWAILRNDPLQITHIRQRFRTSGDL